MMTDRRPLDYGIDAPGLVILFAVTGGVALVLAVLVLAAVAWPFAFAIAGFLLLVALYAVCMAGLMLMWSKVIKVRERERMLDLLALRGDEHVLDVGCGRGLLLIGAALRLRHGRAVGIDIWQAGDQSANSAAAALANAALAGVTERVDVRTADMRALPFEPATFDIVLSHWAVHNLSDAADRALALAEMCRVLKPEGRVLLGDIAHRTVYAAELSRLGLTDQRVVAPPLRDLVLRAVSFGSFRPGWIVARRPADA